MRGDVVGAFAAVLGVASAQQFEATARMPLLADYGSTARFVDLDADGDLDFLAYPRFGSGQLRAYENVGGGHFRVDARVPTVSVLDARQGPFVGDMDGDGRQDVAIGQFTLRNRGASGPFVVAHAMGTPLAIGDFDGDGRQDLVTYDATLRVSVWLARAGFVFTPIFVAIAPERPPCAAVGDLDGDGRVDLVVATNGVEFALRNTGGGNLVYMPSWLPNAPDGTTAIALADFDGDGDRDLATNNGLLWVFRDNNGTGQLGNVVRSFSQPVNSVDVPDRPVDFDGDGRVDFVGTGHWWHDNLPSVPPFDRRLLPGMPPGTLCDVGDVDGDGDLDLLLSSVTGQTFAFRIGLDLGGRNYMDATPEAYASDGIAEDVGPNTTAVADLDRDGYMDILCAGGSLFRNRGDGWFAPSAMSWANTPYYSRVSLCDIDGDGVQDVLAINQLPSRVRPLLNLGGGTFLDMSQSFPFPPMAASSVAAAATGDFDGDRKQDWVYATQSGELHLVRNTGSLTFAEVATAFPIIPEQYRGLAAADVDSDGDLDLAAACDGAFGRPFAPLHLFLNDGSGHFADTPQQLSHTPLPWGTSVQFFDADADGDQDLVAGNQGGYSFPNLRHHLLLNDGTGHFVEGGSLPQLISAGRVAVGDIDGDGRFDLVAECVDGVHYWRNRGGLVFQDMGQVAPYARGELLIADFDRDGDGDVLVGNQLLRNRTRDAAAPYLPLSGQPYALEFGGTSIPTGLAMPFISTARANVPLPPFGNLGIDHSQSIALPWLSIVLGRSHFDTVWPASSALVGVELSIQAVLYDGVFPHLSPPLYETAPR